VVKPMTAEETKKLYGDFYSVEVLADWLGLTVDELTEDERYFSLVTEDGVRVYPAVQFDEHGDVPSELMTVVKELNEIYSNDDGWAALFWLNNHYDSMDERSPKNIELLHRSGFFPLKHKLISKILQRREEGQIIESSLV